MAEALTLGVAACLVLLDGALVLSIAKPAARVWPPPRRASWQYAFTWGLFACAVAGTALVGVWDGNSLRLGLVTRLVFGAIPMACGAAFGLWGLATLGAHASQGLGGELVTQGPYRYSRNPQYVGDIALILGFAVLCGSRLALGAALGGALWFVLAPFAEEPWLRTQLGAPYERYAARVPRFLALPPWRPGS